MKIEIDASQWAIPVHDRHTYIAMSDRLVLYPHSGISVAVWDLENGRSLGLLEGHTSAICRASINSIEKLAVTVAGTVVRDLTVKV